MEFEARKALGSEMAPQLLLCSNGLGPQPPASLAWAVSVRIHNRAPSRRADKGPPLGAHKKEGADLPLPGGDVLVHLSPWKCINSRLEACCFWKANQKR
jgi:hypothetical protein